MVSISDSTAKLHSRNRPSRHTSHVSSSVARFTPSLSWLVASAISVAPRIRGRNPDSASRLATRRVAVVAVRKMPSRPPPRRRTASAHREGSRRTAIQTLRCAMAGSGPSTASYTAATAVWPDERAPWLMTSMESRVISNCLRQSTSACTGTTSPETVVPGSITVNACGFSSILSSDSRVVPSQRNPMCAPSAIGTSNGSLDAGPLRR